MRMISYFLIVLFIFYPFYGRSESEASEVSIHLCGRTGETEIVRQWREILAHSLEKLGYAMYDKEGQNYSIIFNRKEECKEFSQNSCVVKGKSIYCDQDVFLKIIVAIAISALGDEFDSSAMRMITRTSFQDAIIMSDAFLREDAEFYNEAVKFLYEKRGVSVNVIKYARQSLDLIYYVDIHNAKEVDREAPWISIAHSSMESSINYFMSYVFGHELAHAFSHCPFNQPSVMEQSGGFNSIATEQAIGKKMCRSPLLVDEILADRCGLRLVRYMGLEMHKEKNRQIALYGEEAKNLYYHMHEVGKKRAIEAFVYLSASGLNSRNLSTTSDGIIASELSINSNEGYFYPVSRMILFTKELEATDVEKKSLFSMCGMSAEIFAMSAAYTVLNCSGDDDTLENKKIKLKSAAQLFGAFLPYKISEHWKKGEWSNLPQEDYYCE